MLPIPAPIIGSSSASVYHRKLFIPLIYLGATASICYLFLFAFIVSNQTFRKPRSGENLIGYNKPQETNGIQYQSDHPHQSDTSSRESLERRNQFYLATKRKRREEREQLTLSPETNSTSPQPHFERKKLSSLRKRDKDKGGKNGTWRSNPTKIWSGHQDLDHLNSILDRIGHNGGKLSKEVYTYPWIRDEQCKTFTVQFARKDNFKPRALVSFPGSGNSWLRYMIECASGYFTGSVYDDKELFTAGLLGEFRPPNDGSTIVQKTHHDTIYNMSSRQRKAYIKLSELMFGYRGLLLIRNPYDALVSYWNFINTRGHKWIARRTEFDDFRWTKFVTEQIPRWTSLIMSWVENSQDFLLIFYEEVQKNPRQELIRILEYLDQPLDQERLDCLMKQENLEGPFHRPHSQQKTSATPLAVDLIPVTTSQQDKNIHQEESYRHHQDPNEAQTILLLNSKKSQHQQHHPKVDEEQKEDKFLSSSPFLRISTQQQEQHQNQYTSNMTSSTSSNDNHQHHHHQQYHHHDNNHLNGSILRLDLIIQDNIDKINRFFQQKGIPAQLNYSPRPNIKPYFLHTVQ
ncbi:WSC domain-containing protein 1 [Orchesella cincta]|uniref:WSC domain-containing protein 1 n=1 Tax=Orchesella cincta TaxID=48709 RepID=A0A1D2N259_ORCCI|nr:WSC domain-containing protein 1 [Orchesella cincta]